jgi:thioredoxin
MRIVLAALIVCFLLLPSAAQYSGGSGEPNSPYQIATAEDLIALGEDPNDYDKHFIVTADIDLDPNLPGGMLFDRAVIAPDTDDREVNFQGNPFVGVFDGNDYIISNLTIAGDDYLGLFGQLGPEAKVTNVILEDVDIAASSHYVGGLAGISEGTVSNCTSSGSIRAQGSRVGGLMGWNEGSITDCASDSQVKGEWGVGTLAGGNYLGVITTSRSTGAVSGGTDVGGLVGFNNGVITASSSSAAVNGDDAAGGLVGYNPDGSIGDCYSVGAVNGRLAAGGLVGGNSGGSITNCYSAAVVDGEYSVGGLVGDTGTHDVTVAYIGIDTSFWDIEVSGQASMCGHARGGGTCDDSYGKTTVEMQTASTFLDAGWDFIGETANGTRDLWWIDEGNDYPHLWWEGWPVKELDAATFDAEIAEGVVLVDFYTTWCPFCTMQAPILDEVAESIGVRARVAKLDVDQARDVADRYGITAVPTLILFQEGVEVSRFIGLTEEDTLVAAILMALESLE